VVAIEGGFSKLKTRCHGRGFSLPVATRLHLVVSAAPVATRLHLVVTLHGFSKLKTRCHGGDGRQKRLPRGTPLPYCRTSVWKSAVSRAVTGPGVPAATLRPSISTTGITSAAVPVRKHSSEV